MEVPIYTIYWFSKHALTRCAQRGLNCQDVLYVLQHGKRLFRRGAIHVYLRRKDIPEPEQKRFGRLEGTLVVLALDRQTVITVYRNRRRLPRAA